MTRFRANAVTPFAVAATLAVLAAPAQAADDEKGESSYIAGLRACQAKTDPAERLACYDAAVGAMVSASAGGEVRVVDREAVRETRRKLFGFTLPDLGIFGKSDKEDPEQAEEFTTLQTTIASVRPIKGSLIMVTAEGAEWQLDELPNRLMRPKPGDTLEIRKGALSSYVLRIDGQKGVKGRRVR